jgi:hypothetical protein
MIGSENGRAQIICIRAGMKEIDDGSNLGSPSLTPRPTIETAARRFNQSDIGMDYHRWNMLKSAARLEAVLREALA